jgi:hypothetical protein
VQAVDLTVEASGDEQRAGQNRLQRQMLVDMNQNAAHGHRSAPRETRSLPLIADPGAAMLASGLT